METNSYVIASIKWLQTANEDLIHHLRDNKISITGYRSTDGAAGLFSVVVEFLDVPSNGPRGSKKVKIYALVEDMESRLPDLGELLVLTAGTRPVAECIVVEKITKG